MKAELKRMIRDTIRHHLHEAADWPANRSDIVEFVHRCRKSGLLEINTVETVFRFTYLGIECGAKVASYFIGMHDLIEIPMMLALEGLITKEEAEAFYLVEPDGSEGFNATLKQLVLKAYRNWSQHNVRDDAEVLQ